MSPTEIRTALKHSHRLRRLRRSETMRALVRETRLSPDNFILPLFVCEGEGVRREVSSMPGVYNLSVDEAVKEVRAAAGDGIRSVLLFGLPDHKDAVGSASYDSDAPVLPPNIIAPRQRLLTLTPVRPSDRYSNAISHPFQVVVSN